MDQIQIRKVTFGGYHRGDVDKVLSTMRKENSGAVSKREKELQEIRTENATLRARLDNLSQIQEENNQLHQRLSEREEALQNLTEEHNLAVARIEELEKLEKAGAQSRTQLQQDYDQMKGQMERYIRGSQAFDALKEDIGQIEMDARIRAKRLIEQGDIQAARAISDAQEKITEVNRRYEALRANLNAALVSVAAQLQDIRRQVRELDTALDQESAALEEFASGAEKMLSQQE